MSSIVRTKEGTWRAQVWRKGKYASRAFPLKTHANEWAIETERLINLGHEPSKHDLKRINTIHDLVELHIRDLLEVGKPIRRSKRAVLEAIKRDLGAVLRTE